MSGRAGCGMGKGTCGAEEEYGEAEDGECLSYNCILDHARDTIFYSISP
jgi:hypothetical protein